MNPRPLLAPGGRTWGILPEIVDRILSRHASRTDDALVLVARYIGE